MAALPLPTGTDAAFPPSGTSMAAAVRGHDWSATPFGPIAGWPASLKSLLATLLASRQPMLLWWGPDNLQFYNDAFGRRGEDCWGELWPDMARGIARVLEQGPATWYSDNLVPVWRDGRMTGCSAVAPYDRPMQSPAPRIALIHATALAVDPIATAFDRHWPRARRMNLLDDSLSVDRAEAGSLSDAMVQRFIDLAVYAKGTGCDAILFTCSAFGPAIEAAGAVVQLPTLKPNEGMFAQALGTAGEGGTLGLIATFEASLPSMAAELRQMAQRGGQRIELRTAFVPGAMLDLAQGRAEQHHQKIADAARALAGCDVVMLAQFSMAAAQPLVQLQLACPVLGSPDCAVLALQGAMNNV